MSQLKKCNNCKKEKEMSCFVSYIGKETKTCDRCRKIGLKSKRKSKCKHNIEKTRCRECGGGSLCKHNKRKSYCIKCGGASYCEHKRMRHQCIDCEGISRCKHKKLKQYCKECKGASICKHNREKRRCKECKGNNICKHNKVKRICKICDPNGNLIHCIRSRIYHALKRKKTKRTMEYLRCTIEEFKKHIEDQFQEGMTWDNHGDWHIDHIIPLYYENPSIEEVIERLHYKNTQPLWAEENISKGNRYVG